jgi:predicted acylesterase/phospholipase RssA
MPDIAICFSGGGLRATFFHLGAVRLLRDARIGGERALSQVSHICSVSGGSFLAVHLVRNWEKYIGEDSAFAEAEADILKLARWDIRGNVIRRWLLAFPLGLLFTTFRLTTLLEWEYTKFFKKCALRDLTPRPELHLLSTSLTTGQLCSFSRRGLWLWKPESKDKIEPLPGGVLSLSLAIAASSAFPPLFPPVRITNKMLGARYSQLPQEPEYLTDGGVYDNLGSQLASRLLAESDNGVDLILVATAGLLGGLHTHIFLYQNEALRRRVFLQQLQLRWDREALLLLLLGGDAGIDYRLLADMIGEVCRL